MKRSPMARGSGFKRAEYTRPPPSIPTRITRGVQARVTDEVVSIRKMEFERSETYRRLVAALPCANCGLEGSSQAAHPPPTGKGIKEDDRMCFPLCCTRPGVPGCHVDYDQYRLMPKAEMRPAAEVWAAETRERITGEGGWPSGLERWPG